LIFVEIPPDLLAATKMWIAAVVFVELFGADVGQPIVMKPDYFRSVLPARTDWRFSVVSASSDGYGRWIARLFAEGIGSRSAGMGVKHSRRVVS
jgi:hypothetical protein